MSTDVPQYVVVRCPTELPLFHFWQVQEVACE